MPLLLTLDTAAATHTGLVRHTNQDTFGADESLGLYVVCDGMGGAAAGDVASRTAADTFLKVARQEILNLRSPNPECLRRSLQRAAVAANREVIDQAWRTPALRGMGSTLVAACLTGTTITLVNVGDSRAYLIHSGVATQLTTDHSFVAEQVALGLLTPEQAETSRWQSVITRAIGADRDVQPDLFTVELSSGDSLLLTSDGLTRHLTPEDIATTITTASTTQSATQALIDLALTRGGSDNITCYLLTTTP